MILQTSINITDNFRPSSGDTKLRSCVGDVINIAQDLTFEELYIPTIEANIIYEPTPYQSGTTLNSGLIISDDDQIFKNLLVGDTLGFFDGTSTTTTHIIIEKLSNSRIRIPSVTLTTVTGWYFFNATPIRAVAYKYTLNNNSSFNSLIDAKSNYRKCKDDNVWVNDADISNKYGQIRCNGVSTAGAVQTVSIENTHLISPLFLSSQYTDIIAGVKPPYFTGVECIKYSFQIDFYRDINDSIPIDYKNITVDSSTGWFNEKLNGGITNYSISNVAIPASGRIQLDTPTTFTFDVDNTTDAPFTVLTSAIFCINYMPEIDALYQNSKSLAENFLFENAPAGDLIDTYSYSVISTSKLRFTVTIDPSTAAKLKLSEGSFKRYMMWCIVEDETRAIDDRDKVALLVQINEFEQHLTSTNLITSSTRIARHYENLPADGETSDIEAFTADDLVCKMDFSIDFLNKTTNGILINAIKPKIVLRKTGQAEIILDDYSFNTASFPVVGVGQIIDIEQPKPYKIADSDRKIIKIKREYSLDANLVINWSLSYPIFLRWETWRQLLTPTIPIDLFNPTLPNNGINHFWKRLEHIAGYDVYFEVEFLLTENGINYSQIAYSNKILISDFEEGTDFNISTIKAYDSSNNLLINGPDSLLLSYEDVTIEASFNLVAGLAGRTTSDFEIVLLIETFEGGITDVRQCSSVYDTDPQSYFKSVRVVKSIVGSNLVGKAVLDYTKLPKKDKFTIYGRCYDSQPSPTDFKSFMDGDVFLFMDGSEYKFMDQ